MTLSPSPFMFDNSYARDLPGFYVTWEGDKVPSPELILFNDALADELGLEASPLRGAAGAKIFSGLEAPEGAAPLAQVYAGHQFGGFSPQLGDGRALLLGEILDRSGKRRDIQLKGSGPTPFSRGGDGKAGIGPVLREYILGEAMHALGIPTTRALAAVTTGEQIFREQPKPGAVLTRVASSHLRVGTFQFFAARQETEKVRQLADYAIARHDPDLQEADDKYLAFYQRVVARQAHLIAQWILVGFVHGVMNTDNCTISGETIDYGPCAFIDAYDAGAVFSSIDHGGRYAFGRQPTMAQWNLARLAEALLLVIAPDDPEKAVDLVSTELNKFNSLYRDAWLSGMRKKLGFEEALDEDDALVEQLLEVLQAQAPDYTLFFRRLSTAVSGETESARALFDDPSSSDAWLASWLQRLGKNARSAEATAQQMNSVNPIYIARNHKVEEALSAAEEGDYGLVKDLLDVLQSPYDERPGLSDYAEPAPSSFGRYQTFCGT